MGGSVHLSRVVSILGDRRRREADRRSKMRTVLDFDDVVGDRIIGE